MTIDEFFAELKALNLTWSVTKFSGIRCANGDCPILALVKAKGIGKGLDNGQPRRAAEYLGLDDVEDIILAADTNHFPTLRARMIEELGVKEVIE